MWYRATEGDSQLVVMEDNWKRRVGNKAKNSEANKQEMDTSEVLPAVPGTL